MVDASPNAAIELDDADWALISEALGQLEEAWKAGKWAQGDSPIFADTKIGTVPIPPPDNRLHQRMLADLIKIDQECHWRRGNRQKLETYLARWPKLGQDLAVLAELVEAECLTRALWDAMPSVEELRSRFPDVLPRLDFAHIQAEVDTERQTRGGDTSGGMFDRTPFSRGVRQPLTAGQMFGRYQVRSLIGEGAMGWVYRAHHPGLDRDVALKIPRFDVAADAEMRCRFEREAKALAKIRHANICPVYDAGEVDGVYYIAMALIEGRSLAECMRGRTVGQREAAGLTLKLARGLAAAHEAGVVHRDIKPSNVMIECSEGNGQCAHCPARAGAVSEPLLMDFGLARLAGLFNPEPTAKELGAPLSVAADPLRGYPAGLNESRTEAESQLSGSGALLGTLPYMSPEQFDGQPAGILTDVYALGVVLYEALTGRLPFPPEGSAARMMRNIVESAPPRPRTLRPDLDEALEEICLRAIARNPGDRYQSAKELADAMEGWSSGFSRLPQEKPPTMQAWCPGGTTSAMPPKRGTPARRRLMWIVAAAAAAVVMGLLIYIKTDKWSVKFEVKSKPSFPSITRWIPIEPPGVGVAGLRVSQDGGTLFLACGAVPNPSPVLTMDAATGKILQTVHFKDASYDHKGLAASPDDRYLYVTNYSRRDITRVDLKDNGRQTDLLIGGVPTAVWAGNLIEATPDGRKLLVGLGQDGRSVDMDNDFLSIVDIADGKFELVGQVKLDDEPDGRQMAVSGDSRFAYLVTRARKSPSATLYEVSLTAPFAITRRLAFPAGRLEGIVVSNRLKRIFIADSGTRKVQVVDLATFKPISSIDLESCAPVTLALNARETLLVAAAPENKRLFFVDPANGAVLGHLDGFRQSACLPRFSPDDRYLYVPHQYANGPIAAVDLGNLALRYSIVFTSDRGGEGQQIYVMDGDGRDVRRLTNNHASDRCPRWSPDGKRIAFISDRDGPRKICMTDRAGKNTAVLKSTDPVMVESGETSLDWSPDGREIAFVGGDHRALCAVDVNTDEVRTLVEGAASGKYAHHLSISWNKSSGMVLFDSQSPASGYQHAVFEVDPRTRKIMPLVDEAEQAELIASPAVSPDGKQIVAVRLRKQIAVGAAPLCLAEIDGRNARSLPATADRLNAMPHWSPDGRDLVYHAKCGDHWHIFLLRLAGGKPSQLTNGDWEDIEADVTWSSANWH